MLVYSDPQLRLALCAAETSAIGVIHPSPPVQGVEALVGEAEGVAAPKQPLKDLLVQLHCFFSRLHCVCISTFGAHLHLLLLQGKKHLFSFMHCVCSGHSIRLCIRHGKVNTAVTPRPVCE